MMNDEGGNLSGAFSSFILAPSAKRSAESLQGVVNPVGKKWQCGADILVCFFLGKRRQESLR